MAKPRILIVDDEPQMPGVRSRALELIDYDTQIAVNAQTAMDLLQTASPDAVLLGHRSDSTRTHTPARAVLDAAHPT
jgi:CheY-like chemotaxis protein